MFLCFPALTASAPDGTSSRTVVPLPTYAPAWTVTGAMSCESLPTNAPSSMMVYCFFVPSKLHVMVPAPILTPRSDGRVAKIRQVHGLRPGTDHGLLQLHEVADPRALADVGFLTQVREGSDTGVVADRRVADDGVVEDGHATAKPRVDDADAAVNFAAPADLLSFPRVTRRDG